ncbi:MAG: S8 family serine peptidase, partial [Saprospiraceae bacterium]|nr:S8 family serine peptidase [Saprospiraceae bacterium]
MFADMNGRIVTFLLICLTPLSVLAQREEYLVPGHNLFTNNIAALHRYFPQWNGDGIRLSVKEFNFDSTDVDILGRVIANPNAAANVTSHANIMASLAGGAGNADWAGLGAAPGCRPISSSFVGLMPDPDYALTGITVQNHSYGVDIQNWYGSRANAYDQSTLEQPALLHVFSAGNKGDSSAVEGKYAGIPGFANLTGEFKMAKNILLVGSVDAFGIPALRSSKGPAYDGRIKPDLMAFGKGGSSESAALTSGVAAVLQQALLEKTDTLPHSDLIRALLINAADDIGQPGPDFESGFGNLNAWKAAKLVQQGNYATGEVQSGQVLAIPLSISTPVQSFKVTLAWNDPPANAPSDMALLHDLDLRVVSPTGMEYFPWVLNTYPHPDSLRMPARTGSDSLNTVEQILVTLPETGLWEIQIRAPAGLNATQHFGMAWSQDSLHQFNWEYPLKGAPAVSGTQVVLQWQTNQTTAFGTLRWRDVRTSDWQLALDSVALQVGWVRWTFPDSTIAMQLNMVTGGTDHLSDTFLASPELRMRVGFNCPDSVMLFWNPIPGQVSYQLYALGNQYLEPLLTTKDTLIVLQKNAYSSTRFAVAAVHDYLVPNRRSAAPDIGNQGVECYFYRLEAQWYGNPYIELTLSLGTDYGINSITFEKKQGGVFLPFAEQDANGPLYMLTDDSPHTGVNEKRARLNLANGNF